MGHAIDYIIVDKKDEIWATAEDYANWNVDHQENPSGGYHGNLTIHEDIICESYEDAYEKIEELDNGWYDDHAVQFKDKRVLEPTKQMKAVKARAEKILMDRHEYEAKHSVKMRKSLFIGCKECESKITRDYLRNDYCPVCGTDLRAEYITDRIAKYNEDYKKAMSLYKQLEKRQSGKCPVKWLVKVEVHC